MIDVKSLARESIFKLKAYKSARSLATDGEIFLDANESPVAPSLGLGTDWEKKLNRYPQPQPAKLVEAFASLYGVAPDQVFVGRGSDEAIDVLTRSFCEAGRDEVLIHPPTYGVYQVAADTQGAHVTPVPLHFDGNSWRLDLEKTVQSLKSAQKRVKLIYVCSPNNPTGGSFSADSIKSLCRAATNSLVVVDEAYAEFAQEPDSVPLLREFSNLVVLRTLSKAWALAGLRCGVALAHPEIIALLQKVRAPYPLPLPVIELALRALRPEGVVEMKNRVSGVVQAREGMRSSLQSLAFVEKVHESHANFLLVRFSDERAVMRLAAKAGVILRDRSTEPGLDRCVRITVGTDEENATLLNVLKEALQP